MTNEDGRSFVRLLKPPIRGDAGRAAGSGERGVWSGRERGVRALLSPSELGHLK